MEHDERRSGPNHSHAWRGIWNRPMYMDEDSMDAFTIARMTDHNVKGSDDVDFPDEDLPEDETDNESPETPEEEDGGSLESKFEILEPSL